MASTYKPRDEPSPNTAIKAVADAALIEVRKQLEVEVGDMIKKAVQRLRQTNEFVRYENYAKCFHKFKELPLEVRVLIWKFALPDVRILQPRRACGSRSVTQFYNNDSEIEPPAMRGACLEAYRITNEAGSFRFGVGGGYLCGIWSQPDDIVYFSSRDLFENFAALQTVSSTTMAFRIHWFARSDYETQIRFIHRSFPTCKHVILVITEQGLSETDEEAYDIDAHRWKEAREDVIIGLHTISGADVQAVLGPDSEGERHTSRPMYASQIIEMMKLVWARINTHHLARCDSVVWKNI